MGAVLPAPPFDHSVGTATRETARAAAVAMKREPLPVCPLCDELIAPDDALSLMTVNGGPAHFECALRSIIGGVNHIEGRCTCCGGSEPPDPPGLTKRQAALAAVAAALRRRQ